MTAKRQGAGAKSTVHDYTLHYTNVREELYMGL